MRKLTFRGFLATYVKELSYTGTVDISLLAKEAAKENYRLRAPLLLYSATHEKNALVRSQLKNYDGTEALLEMLSFLEKTNIEEALEKGILPEEYQKVWSSFKVRRCRPEQENSLKSAMRAKIIQLQKVKNCSNYRLYKDLNLNPGNINSWLKHGDSSKVSYHTAERIISYMMQF